MGQKRFDNIQRWLTKPDSYWQARRRHMRPNRLKSLPGSGFSPRAGFMLQFKSRCKPTPCLAPLVRPGRMKERPCPVDDDAMINDPGKQPVKIGTAPVRLSAGLRA